MNGIDTDIVNFMNSIEDRRSKFINFIDGFRTELADISNLNRTINVFLQNQGSEINKLDNKINEKKYELNNIKNSSEHIVNMEDSTIPYIITEGYIEYSVYIYEQIKTIVRYGTKYSIPDDLKKIYVHGLIKITVDKESGNAVRYYGELHNYIHQDGTDCGSLCTGNLNIDKVDEFMVSRIKQHVSIANLDSPYHRQYPYRTLQNQVRKIIKSQEERGVSHERKTWSV